MITPPCHPTRHAIERASQRLGISVKRGWSELCLLYRLSVKLPTRYAHLLLERGRLPRGARDRVDYRAAGSALLLCHRSHVVTVYRLDEDQAATVLVWAATGIWPETR